MVKTHTCNVKISNRPKSSDMTYVREWYNQGRLAEGFQWPTTIKPGQESNILNCEQDWAVAGCSGSVTYKMVDTDITIAFSNPTVGGNKLGVGTGGKEVWDGMSSHSYQSFTVYVDSSDKRVKLQFDCKCTGGGGGGTTNICTVNIKANTN